VRPWGELLFVFCGVPLKVIGRVKSLSTAVPLTTNGFHCGEEYTVSANNWSNFTLPVLFINGEIGSYLLNEERTYHVFSRIRLMMKQQVPLGVMGKLNYILEGGVLFGKVPYPLLTHFGSNASYVFQFDHFSLMQANAYAADNYISLHTEWNGKGCLFNLIPGIQRLNLRELVTFKMLWGSLRKKHEEELLLPYDAQGNLLYTNANKPYIEVGVGIGNLLRCVNVYSVWRVTHPDQPLFDYKWSVRFCFQLDK
jgi:hypothetical protein